MRVRSLRCPQPRCPETFYEIVGSQPSRELCCAAIVQHLHHDHHQRVARFAASFVDQLQATLAPLRFDERGFGFFGGML